MSRKRKDEATPQHEHVGDAETSSSPATDESTVPRDAVLDSSGAGTPFLPGRFGSPAPSSVTADDAAAWPPDADLVIEIELAPGMASLGAALSASTGGFLAGAAGTAPTNSMLATVLRQFGLRDARAVFSRERAVEEEARLTALRTAAAMGLAPAERVAAHERLPALSQFVRLRFPPGTSAADVTTALRRLPEIARAVPVPRATPPTVPTLPLPADPLIGVGGPVMADPTTGLESQWYLHRTRVPAAWRCARGAGMVVADIDWGFRTTHEDLQSGIVRRYNAVDGSDDVTHGEEAAHGTAVLGLAGGRANGAGMAGYAPESILWAIQADSAPGPSLFEEPWAEGVDYVRRTDAGGRRKVIILEVQTHVGGNYEQIPSVHRAIRAAIADGCVVCVAAGNGDRPADHTDDNDPFEPTGSILVGATSYDPDPSRNKRVSFSNYGSRVVVAAPGDLNHDLTCGQSADNAFRNGFGGTSGATPKVAGTAALMLSVNPALTHEDVRDILAGTGLALTEDPGKPIGVLVNTEAAVAEALRRRGESMSAPTLAEPGGEPATGLPVSRGLHGVHRRKGQMVLPRGPGALLQWEDFEDEQPAPNAAVAGGPAAGETPPASGDKPLRLFRETVEGTLTQQDRILIVEQAIQMLDNFYVHRPLKEAMHAVRPIQRLRVLLRRLQPSAAGRHNEEHLASELAFHNTLTQVFNSVRDLHTNYQLPRPFRDYIAYLPFEVAPFYDADRRRRYLVTRVVPGYVLRRPDLRPGR